MTRYRSSLISWGRAFVALIFLVGVAAVVGLVVLTYPTVSACILLSFFVVFALYVILVILKEMLDFFL